MHAVFAEINKRRDNQNVTAVIDDEQTSKAKRSSTSIQSDVASFQPPVSSSNGQYDVQSPDSPIESNDTNNNNDGGMGRKSSVKKKKKKKKKTETESLAGIEINEESVPSSEYQRVIDEQTNSRSLLRANTQISLIADGAYPDAVSLFDFHNKPPLLLFTYIFAFIASIDMMVNLPTLYSAIADNTTDSIYYVYILLVYVSAQFVSTLLIGAWLDRRPIIEILSFLTVCIIIGNILYTFGVHNKSEIQMLMGRGICGVGSCILVIGYAHVTRYSKLASRESRILYFRFIVALGTIIGPLIGTIVGGGSVHWRFLAIDYCNSGSFVVGCIALLFLLCLLLFCALECRKQAVSQEQRRVLWGRSEEESQRIDDEYSELHHNINNYVWRPHRFCSREAFMLWCLYTSAVFTFWSFTGAIIPIGGTLGSTKLSVTAVYGVFVYVGLLYLASFGLNKIVFGYLRVRMEKRVIISLILMVIGSLILTSFGLNDADAKNIYKWQILVAAPFLTSGFCISTITIPALYVTLVGAEVSGLGIRMSWFFSLASFGVLAGPIYGYLMWKRLESINFICHANALLLLCAILIGFVFIKIRPNGSMEPTPQARSSQEFNVEAIHAKDSTNNLRKSLLTERL
eukprot:CAMPEP_0202705476 /NCGR_PEP_ID=MMETSP1385-20130828/18013_1 /ASSEMBLY_ACC=CAM_ASM_000861 /TAXON_ID=933848 /ORGANISM="Elphidium margaritaceum" /LENGTH=627 /DNA_ID=CAMNT_0049363707 /DNA_START=27 /DNA_END=1910 /DNA_ORIENTATION=-